MTRKYLFFTQIAYIAHFWNSVGSIYSPKEVAKQKRCVGGVPVEWNLFVPFRLEKPHFSGKKNSPDPKRIFTAKKGRFGGFDNQRIKSDSQNPKNKTWPKFCCTVNLLNGFWLWGAKTWVITSRSPWNFQGTFSYIRTRAQLILDTIGQPLQRDTRLKWDTTD